MIAEEIRMEKWLKQQSRPAHDETETGGAVDRLRQSGVLKLISRHLDITSDAGGHVPSSGVRVRHRVDVV